MSGVLLVGDIHLADRPPSLRTETYASDIISKLNHTLRIAEENDVHAVVWAGDVFHLKAPTRTSHELVQIAAEIGQNYRRPWFIVPGNHDLQHDRLTSLDRQPLGTLFKAGAIKLVGQADYAIDFHLFGIPWLSDWKTNLPVYMEDWRNSDAKLLITHAPIVPHGETRPYEVIDSADWAALMGNRGFCFYGHMHDEDGAYESDGVWFCNTGAISRGSLHESSLRRKPAIALWDGESFTRIEVPHRPAEDVFRLDLKRVEEESEARLDQFLGSIGTTTLDAISVEGVISDLRERGVRREVIEEVESCFETV